MGDVANTKSINEDVLRVNFLIRQLTAGFGEFDNLTVVSDEDIFFWYATGFRNLSVKLQ